MCVRIRAKAAGASGAVRTHTFELSQDASDKLLLELHSAASTLRGLNKPPVGVWHARLLRFFALLNNPLSGGR